MGTGGKVNPSEGGWVLLWALAFVVVWPYGLGTYLAVQFGAENPSTTRSVTGWVFEALWLTLLAFALYEYIRVRMMPRSSLTREDAIAIEDAPVAKVLYGDAVVYRHGSCPVSHQTAEAAEKCATRRRERGASLPGEELEDVVAAQDVSPQDLDVTPEELRTIKARAATGDVGMQTVLATILYHGCDLDGAEKWWREAAAGGCDDAAYNLGVLFNNDRADPDEAELWWRQASAEGHSGAKFALGVLCYQLDDLAGAKRWWLEAARAGNQDAVDQLEVLLDS